MGKGERCEHEPAENHRASCVTGAGDENRKKKNCFYRLRFQVFFSAQLNDALTLLHSKFLNGLWQRRGSLHIPFVPWIMSPASEPKEKAPVLVKSAGMGCLLPRTSIRLCAEISRLRKAVCI